MTNTSQTLGNNEWNGFHQLSLKTLARIINSVHLTLPVSQRVELAGQKGSPHPENPRNQGNLTSYPKKVFIGIPWNQSSPSV